MFLVIIFLLLLVNFISAKEKMFSLKTNVYIINEKGTNTFVCEVAKTTEEWQKGLMFRQKINSNEGMIFIFPYDTYLSFWMKNTYLPLAIIFIDSSKKVSDVFFPEPLSTKEVTSSKPCRYTLEILSNSAVIINVKKGDKIIF